MKREEQLKLCDSGEYTADTLLTAINLGKKQSDRISKKKLLDSLRKSGFLGTGFTAKPHDPIHNKPPKWVREQHWARIAENQYLVTKGQKQEQQAYRFAVFTSEGLAIIERILFEKDFRLSTLKQKLEQQQHKPEPKLSEEEKQLSEEAKEKALAELDQLFDQAS